MAKRLNNPEETITFLNKYHATLKGVNKSKITRVYSEMPETQAARVSPSEAEGISLDFLCCQGCPNGSHSPQSLSPNCDKVYGNNGITGLNLKSMGMLSVLQLNKKFHNICCNHRNSQISQSDRYSTKLRVWA